MSLALLQAEFGNWLMTGSDHAAARFAPTAQAGLLVYQNNYRGALMACLRESFPQTLQWLGHDDFQASAARCIDDCPPDSWSLDHYTAVFPQSLARQWPDDQEVAELAVLELALADAFVGRDAAPLDSTALGLIDWDRAVLRWVPMARLLRLGTNAPAIWSALASKGAVPQAERMPREATVLVWRHTEIACFRTLDPAEAELAPQLLAGMPFAAVCHHLVRAHGEADGVGIAGHWLARWAADGLLDRNVMA
jgi:Putative DNA-binding domain